MELTPTQIECMEKHKAFRAKIERQAKPDTGISWRRRNPGRVPAKEPVIIPTGPTPDEISAWKRRQEEIHKPLKEPWFSIEEEIEPPSHEITVKAIQLVVCRHYGIRLADMLSMRRTIYLALPRQIAGYLAKMLTPLPYVTIGRRFGGRDHSTQIHAVHKISGLMERDPAFRTKVEEIARELGGDLG